MRVRVLGLDMKYFLKEPMVDSDLGDSHSLHSLPFHTGRKASNCSHGELVLTVIRVTGFGVG